MTGALDEIALREKCLAQALPKSESVIGALMAADDIYRWLTQGQLPKFQSAAGASARKDEGTAGASVVTTADCAASVRVTPAVDTISSADEPTCEDGCVAEPEGSAVRITSAGEPNSEIDGGVEGHAAKTATDADDRRDGVELRDSARSEGPAGVETSPSMPPTESGAAAADPQTADGNNLPVPTAAPEPSRGNKSHWTPERDAEFRTMWERGDDTGAIADHFRQVHGIKLTPQSVHAHASKRGIGSSQARNRARHQINARRGGANAWRGVDVHHQSGSMKRGSHDLLMDRNMPAVAKTLDLNQPRPLPVDFACGEPAQEDSKSTDGRSGGVGDNAPAGVVRSRADKIREQMAAITGKSHAVANGDATAWPDDKRASFTALWKAGRTYAEIAEAATEGGYPMKPRDVLVAVAQLGLTNDPDRRRAMTGGR